MNVVRKVSVLVQKTNVIVSVVKKNNVYQETNVFVRENVSAVDELIKKSYSSNLNYSQKMGVLEDAHLISQPYAFAHFKVHWEMFKLAFFFRQWSEFAGQIPRIILAIPGSWLGKAPKGNVGSTRMGIFEKRL